MTPERWQQIEAIYHEASELPHSKRSAFLTKACGGDMELRREVETLLAQDAKEAQQDVIAEVIGATAASLSAENSMVGRQIGPYKVIREIGRGGMGAVYCAEDMRLGRKVALKILPLHLAKDLERLHRFQTEARTASAMNHPNIITLHEIGETEGTPYIVTEYIEGQTLDAKITSGPMPLQEMIEVLLQVSDALDEAHSLGIVHRDIKPQNIMITRKGQVKVLDFGLAKFMSERADRQTRSGAVMGTVQYMSPEQIFSKEVDHRTDLFSLGIVMYEMATGRLPFKGNSDPETIRQILHVQQEPVSTVNSLIPWELDRIIRKCLEKDKHRRYQSALELEVDLRNLKRDSDSGKISVKFPLEMPDDLRGRNREVAVLYFENLSGAKEEEYLRDGMTEDVITELSKIKDLRVYPRSAVLAYRDRAMTAQEIGRQLNAEFVLSGSMRRAGERIRITAQLVETNSGHSAWAERYDRKLLDVLDLQEEIARSIAQALRITLSPQEDKTIGVKGTRNAEVYDLYLRGRNYTRRATRADLGFAIEMFERAIEIEPDFALAHAGLANVCGLYYDWYEQNDYWLRKGVEAAERALAIAPDLAEGLAARARIFWGERKSEEAMKFAKLAIERKHDCEGAYWILGLALFALERCEEGAALIERALEASGDDYNVFVPFINILGYLGRTEETQKLRRLQIQVLKQQLEWVPEDVRARMLLSTHYAYFGNRDEAVRELQKAVSLRPEDANLLYNAACTYAVLQMKPEALTHVKMALDAGFSNLDWVGRDPDLTSLHNEPEFQALLRK